MTILNDGRVGIGTIPTTYTLEVSGIVYAQDFYTYSDKRYKKEIEPIKTALSNVIKLQPVMYYWRKDEFPDKKFDSKKHIGLIAQELETVFPEVVSTDDKGYKSVDYPALVPVLIRAVQELNERVDALEKQNKELEKINLELKNQVKAMQSAGH